MPVKRRHEDRGFKWDGNEVGLGLKLRSLLASVVAGCCRDTGLRILSFTPSPLGTGSFNRSFYLFRLMKIEFFFFFLSLLLGDRRQIDKLN